MKHIDYSFTTSDIKTCIFALTKLSLLHHDLEGDISDAQILINEKCGISAANKLAAGKVEQLTPNELRVLCCCITHCNSICQGVISTDPQTYNECMQYVFSLNKLDCELSDRVL